MCLYRVAKGLVSGMEIVERKEAEEGSLIRESHRKATRGSRRAFQ